MTNLKPPHKSIRIFNLLLAVVLMVAFVFSPVSAFANARVKLNVTGKTLVKDTTYSLKVYNLSDTQDVVFTSENPDIATVDSDGVVTAVSNGTAVISVYIYDMDELTDTLTCTIVVGPPAISVRITKSEITLEEGKKALLRTIVLPYNTVESVKFYVLDPSIATISTGGQITAKAVGETYAVALINNGKLDFCKITVTEAELIETNSIEEAVPTTISEETASEIDIPVSEPETSAPESEIIVSEPEISASEPEITVSKPEITDSESEVTVSEPEITDSEPEITDSESEVTVSEPEITIPEPVLSIPEPEIAISEPVSDDLTEESFS